ncbi:MAG: FprA family A-type flavoprotein [Armatimonadota bacterium]
MEPLQLDDNVYWVGARDPGLEVFDLAMPLERGTTYNAYLVQDERPALIDTVRPPFWEELRGRIEAVLDPSEIRYVVINHHEPDHAGSLLRVLELAPQAQVIISKAGEPFLRNTFHADLDFQKVKDGDAISLGQSTLEFYTAPFLHWPDNMFTYIRPGGILCSSDAFGAHYSTDELICDSFDPDLEPHVRYYYDCIMRPHRARVAKGAAKAAELGVSILAPAHGPIYRDRPRYFVEKYVEWTADQPRDRKLIVLVFASVWDSTRKMATEIEAGMAGADVEVRSYDLPFAPDAAVAADLARDLETADGIVLGAPVMVGAVAKPMWDFLFTLANLDVRGKQGAVFGSYGWQSKGLGLLEQVAQHIGLRLLEPTLASQFVPDADEAAQCREFGSKFAAAVAQAD